ncbi:hypothetical protein SDC9_77855 [bioreactor metagenome]|uniref:Uncharacterized protein n=1 Tax=bioreactor metagenome TaxID=1076179 RepID=A0A644YRZ1_9ZZZZ
MIDRSEEQRIDRQGEEDQCQVRVRPVEQSHRLERGVGESTVRAPPQRDGLPQERGTAGQGDHRVEPAGAADRPQRQRGEHRDDGVEEDLVGHHRGRLHHREHRHVDVRVVLAVADGQRPGVRRGPEEDDQEHHQRRP